MEDVVAIKVTDKKKGKVAFLTWGRVFDRVDPKPLEEAVAKSLSSFGLNDVASVRVCESLQEVSNHKYFYEALLQMSWNPVPYGAKRYKSWVARTRRAILQGKELYFLGGTKKQSLR